MSDLLLAENLTKSFYKGDSEVPVLRGVNLRIGEGEKLAVTGASGAGKSTLLHILGTLEPPSRGKVLFGSKKKDLFRYSERALAAFRNRALGFVFQFHYLLPEFSALENVMMPALISGASRRAAERQALDLLKFVGLEHRLDHRPNELSGGEQQRVAVARSVILRPKLLLADELTGNLDSANSQIVMKLLLDLNQSTGVSILLVTHNAELAGRMDRRLEMQDGNLIENAS